MASKIRPGFVGANVNSHWASQSHFPAVMAHPDVGMNAVCTTKPETAEAARKHFGAKLAFSDAGEMARSPEIDAVVIVVRAPSHHGRGRGDDRPCQSQRRIDRLRAAVARQSGAALHEGTDRIRLCGQGDGLRLGSVRCGCVDHADSLLLTYLMHTLLQPQDAVRTCPGTGSFDTCAAIAV